MPNTRLTLKEMPKTFKFLPKWRNFAKSGHSANVPHRCPIHGMWSVGRMTSCDEALTAKGATLG